MHKLNRKSFGCWSFPLWIGIIIGIAVVVLVVLVIFISKKLEVIKFFLFMKFNVLVKDDEPENIEEVEFDAFIAYRQVLLVGIPFTSICFQIIFYTWKCLSCSHKDKYFMKEHVQQYLEGELGYKLCFHERDFLVGESIPANIEAAINHSRRMIMIISRFDMTICNGKFPMCL